MNPLFTPFTIGDLELPNRLVMAPLTRGRAGDQFTPNDLMTEYYRQRAGAGLIISEATHISPQGRGWVGAPGIHSAEQVRGWQGVTEAVHAEGGRMFLQLWHMGRASHPDFHDGEDPVAPSAIAIANDQIHTPQGRSRIRCRTRWIARRFRAWCSNTSRPRSSRKRPASMASKSTVQTAI